MTKKKFEEIINDAIDDLNSCIKDQERRSTEPYLDAFEKGCCFGKREGFEEAIELLEYIKKVWVK